MNVQHPIILWFQNKEPGKPDCISENGTHISNESYRYTELGRSLKNAKDTSKLIVSSETESVYFNKENKQVSFLGNFNEVDIHNRGIAFWALISNVNTINEAYKILLQTTHEMGFTLRDSLFELLQRRQQKKKRYQKQITTMIIVLISISIIFFIFKNLDIWNL